MKIILPYYIPIGKADKKFYINLNQYRNAHYHTLNSAKIAFKEDIQKQIQQLPRLNTIKLRYNVFAPTKQLIDTNNVASIADKFFCDALVEAGKLEDDNYQYLIFTSFEFGGIDKGNPRVEVEIEETKPMQVTFNKTEILAALQMYAGRVMNFNTPQVPDIQLEALGDGSFCARMEVEVGTFSQPAKPPLQAQTNLNAPTTPAGPNSRAAVAEALAETKKTQASKPSLLNSAPKPTGSMPPIKTPEPVEDAVVIPEKNPTQAVQNGAATAEPTVAADAPNAETSVEPKPQITASPEDRKEAGTIGGAVTEPAKEAPKSIFSFKTSK